MKLLLSIAALTATTVSAQYNAGPDSTKSAAGGGSSLYTAQRGQLCDTTDPGALSVIVSTSSDATLFEGQGDVSASMDKFGVGMTDSGIRRGLLQFNFSAVGFPSDIHVECVEIGLRVQMAYEDDYSLHPTSDVSLYRVTTPWTTTDTNDLTLTAGNDLPVLEGAKAANKDCTWTHSSYPSAKWNTPGGDYDRYQELSADAVDASGRHWFGSTRNARDVVQEWLDGSAPNYGFALVGPEKNDMPNSKYNIYHGVGSQNWQQPKLIIKYTAPSKGYPVRTQQYYDDLRADNSSSWDPAVVISSFAGGVAVALFGLGAVMLLKRRMKRSTKEVVMVDPSVDVEANTIS